MKTKMSEKYVPHRRCVGCMQSKPKDELIRVADGNRGVYVCKNEKCLAMAIKKKRLPENAKELAEVINANDR